jgi:hypothetical protein
VAILTRIMLVRRVDCSFWVVALAQVSAALQLEPDLLTGEHVRHPAAMTNMRGLADAHEKQQIFCNLLRAVDLMWT